MLYVTYTTFIAKNLYTMYGRMKVAISKVALTNINNLSIPIISVYRVYSMSIVMYNMTYRVYDHDYAMSQPS